MAATASRSAGGGAHRPSLLVGRKSLRATLTAAVEALADGRGALVLLTGEAGIGKTRLLNEAELLPRSYGGDTPLAKFKPAAAAELTSSLPAIAKALLRRKVTPAAVFKPHKLAKSDLSAVKKIYDTLEGRDERDEFNIYISGRDEDLT